METISKYIQLNTINAHNNKIFMVTNAQMKYNILKTEKHETRQLLELTIKFIIGEKNHVVVIRATDDNFANICIDLNSSHSCINLLVLINDSTIHINNNPKLPIIFKQNGLIIDNIVESYNQFTMENQLSKLLTNSNNNTHFIPKINNDK